MKTFKDVLVWKESYKFTLLIYKLTNNFPTSEEFGLKSQMRRAAVSIISNFAEGFKKASFKEKNHFYKISEGSLEEIKCQTMLSKDLSYLSEQEYEQIALLENTIRRLLHGWIKSQKSHY